MQPTPSGWPRISTALIYDDPRTAIDWLCRAFGFEVRTIVEDRTGAIVHSEVVYGDGVIMVSSAKRPYSRTPHAAGGNTQSLMVYVDDVEAHLARALAHGAEIFEPMRETDYGPDYWSDRIYGAIDREGHHWWFAQRLRTGDANWDKVRNRLDRV